MPGGTAILRIFIAAQGKNTEMDPIMRLILARLAGTFRPAQWLVLFLFLAGVSLVGCDRGGSDEGGDGYETSEAISAWGGPIPRDASLREILQHPDVFQRVERVSQFFQAAQPDQLDQIVYEFRTAALDRGDMEYALFGSWWARFDPQAAYLFADSEIRMEQPRVIAEVLRTWAHQDPNGLMESGLFKRATGQLRGLRSALVDAVVVGWFESDQPGLADFVLSQTDSESRQTALKAWVRMKVLRDGDLATLEWTQSVDYHANVKRELLGGALSIIAHQNPRLCIDWLKKAKESGLNTGTFVARIANAWGHHDPRAAMDWVLDFPETAERWRAIGHISRKWRQRDVNEMQDWLDQQDSRLDQRSVGMLRYQVLTAIVKQNDYRVDWADLIRRAGMVSEKNRRDINILWVLKRWYVADPSAAQAWMDLNPHDLPEVVLERGKLLEDEEREKMEKMLGLSSEA